MDNPVLRFACVALCGSLIANVFIARTRKAHPRHLLSSRHGRIALAIWLVADLAIAGAAAESFFTRSVLALVMLGVGPVVVNVAADLVGRIRVARMHAETKAIATSA